MKSILIDMVILSIKSNPSVHSPLNPASARLIGYFLFLKLFSVKPRDGCDVLQNTSRSVFCEILRPAVRLDQETCSPRSKSLQSPLFRILMLTLDSSESPSPRLHAWMHRVAAKWLADLLFMSKCISTINLEKKCPAPVFVHIHTFWSTKRNDLWALKIILMYDNAGGGGQH